MLLAIIIFGVFYAIPHMMYKGVKGNNHVFKGSQVLMMLALQASKKVVLCIALSGIMGALGFGMLSMIPLVFSIYYGILAFPIVNGWLVATASGYFGDELFANLPTWMLEHYNKAGEFRLDDLLAFHYGEINEVPPFYFTKWAYEDKEFVENIYQEYEEMCSNEQ